MDRLQQAHFLTPKPLRPDAPLFIFLPGMDGTGRLLHTQVDGLDQAFDIRCLSVPVDDLSDWCGLTAQVAQLIRQEQRSHRQRPVYLCGESFGGCLALQLAVTYPDCFDRMILINPASSFNQHPIIRWSSGLTPWIPAPFYQLSTYGLLPLLAALERIAPHNRQILLETMQTVAQKTSAWRLSLLEQFKIQPAQLRRITQPVLLIAGAADRLLPSVKEVKRLAQYFPKARVRILPQSGHACLLEEDVNLYDILRQENALEPSFFRAS